MQAAITSLLTAPPYPAALIDRVLLADGRSVVVRPVLPQDAASEQAFVGEMSPATRLLRFHLGMRELAPKLLRDLTQIDYLTHVAVVAQASTYSDADDDGNEPAIVADARYVLNADDTHEAEFAIAVTDAWQGVGLGRQLMSRLMEHARKHGVTRLVGDVLYDNTRMTSLVRQSGGRLQRHPLDATLIQARFEL